MHANSDYARIHIHSIQIGMNKQCDENFIFGKIKPPRPLIHQLTKPVDSGAECNLSVVAGTSLYLLSLGILSPHRLAK